MKTYFLYCILIPFCIHCKTKLKTNIQSNRIFFVFFFLEAFVCVLEKLHFFFIIFYLFFAVPPNISDIESTPSSVAVRENQNINMTCRAEGFPTPKIIWRRWVYLLGFSFNSNRFENWGIKKRKKCLNENDKLKVENRKENKRNRQKKFRLYFFLTIFLCFAS